MEFKNNQQFLFLRMSNFDKYDFIDEHTKIINEHGYVWILKTGRKIDKKYLKELIKSESGIIIKKPSRTDDKLYYCKLENIDYDNSEMFPEYYYDFLTYNGFKISDINHDNSCWFKISSITPIPSDITKDLVVTKNNNSLLNAAINSRAPYIFCKYLKGSESDV